MNNNNRCNGQSVRLVQHLPYDDTLLTDLFRAYYDARRNKRTTQKFRDKLLLWEKGLDNLSSIHDKRERERWLADCRACVNSYLGYLGHFKADSLVSGELSGSKLLEVFAVEKTENARWGKINTKPHFVMAE